MSFLASVATYATRSKPPPMAAATFGPAFTVQVQVSSLTSAHATTGTDDKPAAVFFLVRNDMFSTNSVPSEASIVKQEEQILRQIPSPRHIHLPVASHRRRLARPATRTTPAFSLDPAAAPQQRESGSLLTTATPSFLHDCVLVLPRSAQACMFAKSRRDFRGGDVAAIGQQEQ